MAHASDVESSQPALASLCRHAAGACVIVCLTVFAGCGGGTPTAPSGTPTSGSPSVNLSGRWTGFLIEGSDREPVIVNLVQNGGNITGTTETALFRGTVTGTLTGTSLSMTATVARGGVVGEPNCTIQTQGTAQNVTSTTIAGNYTGQNSCSGAFSGRMELTR